MTPRDDLRERDDGLIAALPDSEFGRAFLSRLKEWLEQRDADYFLNFKICDDPLREDFRFKAGAIWMLKEVLNEPLRIKKEQQSQK